MRDMGIVRGDKASAIPFQAGVDTVYVRMNIQPVPESEGGGYQWHEIQHTLAEWLQAITEATVDVESFALEADTATIDNALGTVKDLQGISHAISVSDGAQTGKGSLVFNMRAPRLVGGITVEGDLTRLSNGG